MDAEHDAQAGDTLLFHSRGRWYERAIVAATSRGDGQGGSRGDLGADYVHAALAVDAAHMVEALPQGVTRSPIPWNDAHVVLVPTHSLLVPGRVAALLAWLNQQVGARYGWDDVLDAGLRRLWPHGWRVSHRGMRDCSCLVATALAVGGYPLPPDIIGDLDSTSPNDLARALGLLPGYPAPGAAPYPPRG